MNMIFNRLPWLNCFNGRRESCEELLPLSEYNREPVILNVYDLFNVNEFGAARIGLGIFHTGIQVYDKEYTYGGHSYSNSGIFEIMPRTAEIELGEHFHYRESIQLGYTQFTRDEVMRIVEQLGCQFTGNSYHLTSNNCNHFSDAMSRILCGQQIPKWINRLAYFIDCVPFLQRCLPTEWMSPM
ncbi:deubiquitinase DESI2 [Drosophila nasuta]|uniref:deubiquitinase DESI2 n=1 Tax=Drosophila nasuta TaxID=42062 RepID=UPI00295EEE71|nr:deubiquitinase DESI2 [Drosophila nasuta]